MTIPDYQSIMLPLLKQVADQREYHRQEIIGKLTDQFELTEEEQRKLLPSGQQTIIENRVGWAIFYLKKAALLEKPQRAYFKISQRGLDVIGQNPSVIDVEYLEQFPEFVEFMNKKTIGRSENSNESMSDKTPEETLQYGYQKIRDEIATELLKQIKNCSPYFFERLVVELLVAIGYGGSIIDAGRAIGKTGDGGIDGIIKEDKLGLDVIYIQAKRWDNTIGRPEIMKFAGALEGQRARKGVFITTADFSKDAIEYVKGIDKKIILIDGEQLTQLMIDYDIGVTKVASYDIKRIDSDYFIEE